MKLKTESKTKKSGEKAVKSTFEFEPIGYIDSCFKEKFGIPRQPGLVQASTGVIKLRNDPDMKTAIKSLEKFSHIWVIFVFHDHGGNKWKPTIRPPRLGGKQKVGVLASRSPHRPNPIGLSAVTLDHVDMEAKGGAEIHVRGLDLLDGTPILDIKPYIAYADIIEGTKSGWAAEPIVRNPVVFTPTADAAISERVALEKGYANLKKLIIEILELDPRPAFQQRNLPRQSPNAQGLRFGFKLFDFDVKWDIQDEKFVVVDVVDLPSDRKPLPKKLKALRPAV